MPDEVFRVHFTKGKFVTSQTAEKTSDKTKADSLFDLDDILGDALDGDDVAGVATQTTAAAPAAAINSTRLRAPAIPNTLYFDLETVPDYSREELFGLDPAPSPAVYAAENEGPAPSELIKETVDEVKVVLAKANGGPKKLPKVILEGAIVVEQKRPKPRKGVIDLFSDLIAGINGEAAMIQSAIDARRKTMSVTPEFCRIVSFGWAMGDDPAMASVFGEKNGTKDHDTYERAVLKKFWELAARSKLLVGFNVIGFDLPVIYTRSILLGVEPSRKIDLKPWGGEVCDVMALRWPRGGQKSMKDFCRIMGLPIPAGDMDGSQVEETLKTDPFRVGEYNRSDVSLTREIHLMGRGLFF